MLSDQGRFGPPPVVALWVTYGQVHGRARLAVTVRREGAEARRELELDECSPADALEAAVTELYRLLR